ncbi:MAG TPA: hypothetical protein VG326_17585 [Tepidisphaeraceae bacterium]|jgi:gas vesicle protein|nr:hypothetical protein [Tepidisphaeraceae bacterium]
MKARPTTDTAILVGGALLGAAAMFFMDPEVGRRRRTRVAAAAEGAYGAAREAVSDRLHDLSGNVKDLAHRVSSHVGDMHHHAAHDTHALADEARAIAAELTQQATAGLRDKQSAAEGYGQHASEVGHRLWERARGLGARLTHMGESVAGQAHDVHDDLASRARNWRGWLSKRTADAHSQAQSWLGHEDPHPGVGAVAVISTAVGCCAVGAGMMYFMDPLRGRSRREEVWNKTSEAVRNAGDLMRATGTDLANRFYGSRGGARQLKIDSRELINEIRARVGGWIAKPNDVQFLTDADGSVTVTGHVVRDELERLLTHLHDVPGVNTIINRLTLRETPAERQSGASPASAQS